MAATANRFAAGHRLRVDVCSADFPKLERNSQPRRRAGPARARSPDDLSRLGVPVPPGSARHLNSRPDAEQPNTEGAGDGSGAGPQPERLLPADVAGEVGARAGCRCDPVPRRLHHAADARRRAAGDRCDPAAGGGPVPDADGPQPVRGDVDRRDVQPMSRAQFENDYVLVVQNERGTEWSEGEFGFLTKTTADAQDTLDWIAAQDWSNGKVGLHRLLVHGGEPAPARRHRAPGPGGVRADELGLGHRRRPGRVRIAGLLLPRWRPDAEDVGAVARAVRRPAAAEAAGRGRGRRAGPHVPPVLGQRARLPGARVRQGAGQVHARGAERARAAADGLAAQRLRDLLRRRARPGRPGRPST